MEKVYPSQKVTCQHSQCSFDDPTIGNGERVRAGFRRDGTFVEHAAIHMKCFNLHGDELKKKFKEVQRTRDAEMRYEVSSDHLNFAMPSALQESVVEAVQQLAAMIEDRDIPAFDRKLQEYSRELEEIYDVYVDPQILNNQAFNRAQGIGKTAMVGQIVGEPSSDAFTFESYHDIRKFDFVALCPNSAEADILLAQVQQVRKNGEGKCIADADIIGYRDEGGLLRVPRSVASPGTRIYLASQELVSDVLDLDTAGLYVGPMSGEEDLSVYLDPKDFFRHAAVLAKTGSGKSYCVGVIMEEMVKQNIPVVIVDTHGEYHTLAEPNKGMKDHERKKYGVDPRGFNTKQYAVDTEVNPAADQLRFDAGSMNMDTWKLYTDADLSAAQQREMRKLFNDLEGSAGIDELIRGIEQRDMKTSTKNVLLDLTVQLQGSPLFQEHTDFAAEDLIRPGAASIVNMRGVDIEEKQKVVNILATQLFEARKREKVPPCVLFIEEAHNFAPNKNREGAACEETLADISAEGRKFGFGLGVVSQRPSRVNSDILSQTGQQVVLKVTNDYDVKQIRTSFENVTRDTAEQVRKLPQGTALVLGKEYPIMADVRVRHSKHGGEDKEFETTGTSEEEGIDAYV